MNTGQWLERPRISSVDDTAERFSIGEEFARSVIPCADKDFVSVAYRTHLTSAFPLFAHRPRYTVRDLVKVASTADRPVRYTRESVVDDSSAGPATSYRSTREARAVAVADTATITEISVDVPVPIELLDDSAQLAQFVDYRVLVRLSVQENQTLLRGSADGAVTGLLSESEIRRRSEPGAAVDELVFDLAADVEEAGGSLDGMVVNPHDYWRLVRSGALALLQSVGVKVSRTRMMPKGQILLGDFSAAATLFLPRVGSVDLSTGENASTRIITARARLGFAVPLPDHLIVVDLVESP